MVQGAAASCLDFWATNMTKAFFTLRRFPLMEDKLVVGPFSIQKQYRHHTQILKQDKLSKVSGESYNLNESL